jgi:hypothetical protein
MSGSPVISSEGEVLGILTLAGNGKFRGLSFGVSFEEAKIFLAAEGVIASVGVRGSRAIERNWPASSSAKPGGREAHDTFVPFAFSPLGNDNPYFAIIPCRFWRKTSPDQERVHRSWPGWPR